MKNTAKIIRVSALAAAIILCIAALDVEGANIIIGGGLGYSVATSPLQNADPYYGYRSRSLGTGTIQTIGIGFSGHFGLLVEGYIQNYDVTWHIDYTPTASYPERFLYLGAALEYRFFQDIRRSFNPYVSLGVYGLLYLDLFGSGAPEYPRTTSFNFSAGTRVRLVKALYFNPRISYVSGSSCVVFQAGLDLII